MRIVGRLCAAGTATREDGGHKGHRICKPQANDRASSAAPSPLLPEAFPRLPGGGGRTRRGLCVCRTQSPSPDSRLCPCSLAQSLWALFTSTLAISLVFAIIPLCRDVQVLASVMALAGLAMGCIDTVANMQLVRIYQKDSAVFLQVSPLVGMGLGGGRPRGAPWAPATSPGPLPGARCLLL